MTRRLVQLSVLFVLAAPAFARAADPVFVTSQVGKEGLDRAGTEPRIAVGPDNTRYVSTNEGVNDVEGWPFKVFSSVDGGLSWQETSPGNPPPQRAATIDTDVVTMPTGRILASELDYGGLNFPSAYSDDQGQTWNESRGATELTDQDRQWFAVGPVPKGSTQPPVYLLYHNFASGIPQHNMWVSTSNDGGATFGPPVPTAQPGSEAYQDLQCSDSGGPSSITVNPDTGHIYVVFTTRAGNGNPAGLDLGGCAATPLEFNIVNGTRVWVADSATGAPGTWHDSLAVDRSKEGNVVSQQLAYGALDNKGNFYVAYPESPKAYPDLTGTGVKLTWQTPNSDGVLDGKWSDPAVLVPQTSDNGSDLVHIVAGDPGSIAVAYYKSETVPGAKAPVWYTHILQSFDAMSPTPHVNDYKVTDIPAYQWTASEMMGICSDPSDPTGGIKNGLSCDRSTDVWGISLDAQCRVMAVWPAFGAANMNGSTNQKDAAIANNRNGTFTTTQVDGPGLCASPRSLPGGSQAVPFKSTSTTTTKPGSGGTGTGSCTDKTPPVSHVVGRVRASRKRVRMHGLATDRGCGVKGAAAKRRVRSMSVAIGRRLANRKCRFLRGNGKFGPQVSCLRTTYIVAKGTSSWRFSLKAKLPRGRYVVWTRGFDVANNIERKNRKRNLERFRVR